MNWLKFVAECYKFGSENVENSPKYLNYRIFKKNFRQKMYLKKLRNDLRVIFTKLRNCNHKLPIETGRCKDISVSVTYHVYNLSR